MSWNTSFPLINTNPGQNAFLSRNQNWNSIRQPNVFFQDDNLLPPFNDQTKIVPVWQQSRNQGVLQFLPQNNAFCSFPGFETNQFHSQKIASFIEENVEKDVTLFGYKQNALRFGNLDYFNCNYAQPPETAFVMNKSLEMVQESPITFSQVQGFSYNSYPHDIELGDNLNRNNHETLVNPPKDTVTKLRFLKGQSDLLAVASWDGSVRFWKISQASLNKFFYYSVNVNGIVMDIDWSNQPHLLMGHSDGTVSLLDVINKSTLIVGTHCGPVKCVSICDVITNRLLLSGSYDGLIKIWDTRSQKSIFVHHAGGKVYGLCSKNQNFAYINSNGELNIYDIGNPPILRSSINLSNGFPLRSLVLENMSNGPENELVAAIGTTNGRVFIISLTSRLTNFSFKTHRHTDLNQSGKRLAYPIHDLAFQPHTKLLATGGGDGIINVWDINRRVNVEKTNKNPLPITSLDFSNDGDILAYAVGYDWSRGIKSYKSETMKPEIYLKTNQNRSMPNFVLK